MDPQKNTLQRRVQAFRDKQDLRRREQSDSTMAMAVFEETERQRFFYKVMVVFAICSLIATAICIWILYSLKRDNRHQEFDNLVYSSQGLLAVVIIGLVIIAAYRIFREEGSVLSKNRMKTIEQFRGTFKEAGRKGMEERNKMEQTIGGQGGNYDYNQLGDRVSDDMGGFDQQAGGMDPYQQY